MPLFAAMHESEIGLGCVKTPKLNLRTDRPLASLGCGEE